jgi:hypothetical protein
MSLYADCSPYELALMRQHALRQGLRRIAREIQQELERRAAERPVSPERRALLGREEER